MNNTAQCSEEQIAPCLFCGEPEELSISEIWSDHNFQLSACCGDLLAQVSQEINDDPAWGRDFLRRLGAEELMGYPLRRVADGDCGPLMLDCKLTLRDIDHSSARAFLALHHAHCSPPRVWRFGTAIMNGWSLLGVVIVGNPVAPALNGTGAVEVNRLCVRRDIEPMLARDCCSKLYAWSAREAERRGFSKIITYTRIDELGTSLTAAGWTCEGPAGGRGWHSKRRSRSNINAWIKKVRWSRTLRPKPLRPPASPHFPAVLNSGWTWAAGLTSSN